MKKLVSGSIFTWVTALLLAGCSNYYQGAGSDHFDGEKFFNPGKPMNKGLGTFLKWKFTAEKEDWPEFSDLNSYDQPPDRVTGDQLRVSFVGHATVLLQTQGLNILTDPIWSERASPVKWAGPRRVHPPGIAMKDLPPIDLILVSHNHYDHLDLPTLEQLWLRYRPRILVPLGNDTIISAYNSAIESEAYDWGDEVQISTAVSVYLEPMHHWSARGIFDRNRSLWAAFTITTPGGNIYFAGDSGYGEGDYFRAARDKFQSFRLAILPIGSYDPRWFMAYGHMNPKECIAAFEDLGKPMVLPTHHKMFQLADTGYDQPLSMLLEAMAVSGEADGKIVPLMAGESWNVPEPP
jgi:L-ascorbate metabolism protein UlaG (beta-lactamase superfamily)